MDETQDLEQLKFPIGKFSRPEQIGAKEVHDWIDVIQSFPEAVSSATNGLTEEQLGWKYRTGGWSIRQLVHHCADSHMNSFIRFKLTMTEDSPMIKPYFEDKWAEMSDYIEMGIEPSLQILKGLHERWSLLLLDLHVEDWDKVFVHPEHGRKVSLGVNIALYDWHCRHHLAHIHQALKHKGKFN